MGSYVETWKAIATAINRSERWCRNMMHRGPDPLPVFKVGGIVRLELKDLDDWLARQRARAFAKRGAEPLLGLPLKLIA